MDKFRKILQALLIGWGLISLVAVLIWTLSLFRGGDPAMREGGSGRTDKMTPQEVLFILRAEPLNTAKLESVVHSFESARAFTGDHRDAVAIKVNDLPAHAFEKLVDHLHASWTRGDKADDLIRSALATGRIKEWQPDNAEVLTSAYFINPRRLVLRDGHVTAAELIYVNLKTQMVYYISFKF